MAGVVDLARRYGARLTLAQLLKGADKIDPLSRREGVRELEALIPPTLTGLDVDYRLIDGDAATVAAEGRYDLVVPLDDEDGSESARRDLSRLLRASRSPVWIERGGGRAPRGILAAVDLQTRNALKRGLNLEILRHAVRLTGALDARLDVLTVWTPPLASERLVRRAVGVSEPAAPTRKGIEERLRELMSEARHGLAPLTTEPRLLTAQGDPDQLIAQAAASTSVDLLVAGCVGRDGLAAWLVGDTAERLSHRLDCSILAVKPTSELLAITSRRSRRRAA